MHPSCLPTSNVGAHSGTVGAMLLSSTPLVPCRPLWIAALALVLGCPGDDATTTTSDNSPSTTDTETTETGTTQGATTQAATTMADTTTGAADCLDAVDQASCSAAQNLSEGGGCAWMVIHELAIEEGACNFTSTDRGACVGIDGLDDGCTHGSLCDSGDVGAYYRELGDGTWEVAQGAVCRGISGFLQCNDKIDEPCTCACEIP